MFDHLFTNAVGADGAPLELAVASGRFAAIGPALPRIDGVQQIDLGGQLVLPGLVDGHIHLDKSFVGDRWHPHRPARTLRERLAIEKQELAVSPSIVERADALVAQAAGFGTVAMRSHVDVDATTGLDNLHAVNAVRERWRGTVDIELVAFPQAGVLSCPGTAQVLDAAMREGAQVVGGIDPDTLDGDSTGQLDVVFGIAGRYAAKVDIHLHEPGLGGIEQLRRIAERSRTLGMQGRVAVSHAYALGEVGQAQLERIANDNIRDAWWPYGNGDMLQRAMLLGYRSGFHADEELCMALEMASGAGARVIGLQGHGLAVGNEATFLVLDAPNAAAAVAGVPCRRRIVRRGQWAVDATAS